MNEFDREAEIQCCNCGYQFHGSYNPEIDGYEPTECPKCGEDMDLEFN
jgi:DNA-directed RNA polymerase subunit RPC12/RpoP